MIVEALSTIILASIAAIILSVAFFACANMFFAIKRLIEENKDKRP